MGRKYVASLKKKKRRSQTTIFRCGSIHVWFSGEHLVSESVHLKYTSVPVFILMKEQRDGASFI